MRVTEYQTSKTEKITIQTEAAERLKAARVWPRNRVGEEFHTVYEAERWGEHADIDMGNVDSWIASLSPDGPRRVACLDPYSYAFDARVSSDDLASVELRLAPMDVGFDVRTQAMAVAVPVDCDRATYATRSGERWYVEGSRGEVIGMLRSAGYTVAELATER